MEERMLLRKCIDSLENVSLRLQQLSSVIHTMCLGLKCENIEQQAVDCMECIAYCVNDIRAMVLDELQQIQDEQSNMDKR